MVRQCSVCGGEIKVETPRGAVKEQFLRCGKCNAPLCDSCAKKSAEHCPICGEPLRPGPQEPV